MAGKSGKPKEDFPSIDPYQEIKALNFSNYIISEDVKKKSVGKDPLDYSNKRYCKCSIF